MSLAEGSIFTKMNDSKYGNFNKKNNIIKKPSIIVNHDPIGHFQYENSNKNITSYSSG